MIIPVKCFTCGMVLADKYRYYQNEVRRIKLLNGKSTEKVIYLTKGNAEKTIEGTVLDDLVLYHVNIYHGEVESIPKKVEKE
jgi:DNA-directed RNA polymerase I, II, and III subunit RPABC5